MTRNHRRYVKCYREYMFAMRLCVCVSLFLRRQSLTSGTRVPNTHTRVHWLHIPRSR